MNDHADDSIAQEPYHLSKRVGALRQKVEAIDGVLTMSFKEL